MARAAEHIATISRATDVLRSHRQNRKTPEGKPYVLLLGQRNAGDWVDLSLMYPTAQWTAKAAHSHALRFSAIDFEAAGSVKELRAPSAPSVPDAVARAADGEFYRHYERTGSAMLAKVESDQVVQAWRESQQRHRSRRVCIEAAVQELADTNEIPAEIMAEVKKTDPHPLIAVFRVGKEGVSNGARQRKVWSFGAIRELARKISESIGSVIGDTHTTGDKGWIEGQQYVTDAGERRGLLGRIVHAAAKKVGEALEAIAYVHVTDPEAQKKIKSGEYNVCSIDAFCRFDEDPTTGSWFIRQVERFRNLVIADGRKEMPGFAEAGLVATVQELVQEAKQMADAPTGGRALSKADVLVAIEQLRLQPEDIFRDNQLLGAAPVKTALATATAEIVKAKDGEIAKLSEQVKEIQTIKAQAMLADAVKASKHLADKGDKYQRYILEQIKADLAGAKDKTEAQKIVDAAIESELGRMTKFGIKFEAAAPSGNSGSGGQPRANDGNPDPGKVPADSSQTEPHDSIWKDWDKSPLNQV